MTAQKFKILLLLWVATLYASLTAQAQNNSTLVKNLKKHVQYLASDKLEGRGTATPGEKKAYLYIQKQFKAAGLTPKGNANTYLQPFNYTVARTYLPQKNTLTINNHKLTINTDFYPLQQTTNITNLSTQIVNVKGGVQLNDLNINHYKNLNVQNKIVIIDVFDNDTINPHSKYSSLLTLDNKLKTAQQNGAAAAIIINTNPHMPDPVFEKTTKTTTILPTLFLKKDPYQKLFANNPANAQAILTLETNKVQKTGHNIIGFIDNKAPNTIIIGAHYDHLGYGEQGGSLDPHHTAHPQVHNGADDNASGAALIIELAKKLKNSNLKNNNYLITAFSGEELGLLGSDHLAKNLPIDTGTVSYMLNFDMVGRLDTQKQLIINAIGTSPTWKPTITTTNQPFNFTITTTESGVGASDHTSFYHQKIPAIHFFTNTHTDYHKPTDDTPKINFEGIAEITNYTYQLIQNLNPLPKLTFTKTKVEEAPRQPFKVTLGIMPNYAFDGEGVQVNGATDGKPAQKAGIIPNDIIIQIGNIPTPSMQEYMGALSKFEKNQQTTVTIIRNNQKQTLNIQF